MEKTKKSRYQRKLFAYFMAVAVIPLCILGMFSYHTAKEALRENIHHGNEAALAQIENKTEKALEMIRIDFLGTAVSPVTQRMINSAYDEIPYPELRDFKDGMGGQESYSDYVKSYSFINLKHGWILGNKGYIRWRMFIIFSGLKSWRRILKRFSGLMKQDGTRKEKQMM